MSIPNSEEIGERGIGTGGSCGGAGRPVCVLVDVHTELVSSVGRPVPSEEWAGAWLSFAAPPSYAALPMLKKKLTGARPSFAALCAAVLCCPPHAEEEANWRAAVLFCALHCRLLLLALRRVRSGMTCGHPLLASLC